MNPSERSNDTPADFADGAAGDIRLSPSRSQPEAAALDRGRLARFATRDDVDGATDCVGSEQRRPGAVQDLNPLDELERHRDVAVVMARLGVVQPHAINEHQHLPERGSTNREVGLHSALTASPDVDR